MYLQTWVILTDRCDRGNFISYNDGWPGDEEPSVDITMLYYPGISGCYSKQIEMRALLQFWIYGIRPMILYL